MGIVNGMGDVIGRGMLCTLALACAGLIGIETRPVAAQSVESSGLEFPSDGSYLRRGTLPGGARDRGGRRRDVVLWARSALPRHLGCLRS